MGRRAGGWRDVLPSADGPGSLSVRAPAPTISQVRRRCARARLLRVQEAFGIVLFGVVALAALVALTTLGSAGSAFDHIGADGLHPGADRSADEPPSGGGARVRDEEARQMLAARNARRVRQGKAPLDVEGELARLLAAPPARADPQLAAEVRSLVLARNRRRARQGRAPLDVEAEVARQLSGPT